YAYARAYSDMYPPRISFVYGEVGSDDLIVSFSEAVYRENDGTGDLSAAAFSLSDSDNGRTIIAVDHVAGAAVATLTLSSPLDASADLGVDTLAAASAASIYDASGNPMGTTATVIAGDAVPPSLTGCNPANGASAVALNGDLSFLLTDGESGIDWTTFSLQISGSLGYAKIYTDEDAAVVSHTGSPSSYRVTVKPDLFFGSGEVLTVTVQVADLAGNPLSPTLWSFTTAGAAMWETPDAVVDSFYLSSSSNLIDGNIETGNAFSAGGPNHYTTCLLDSGGDLYEVTAVRIYGGPSYTRSWRIYTSKDGLAYKYIQSFSVGGASQWYEYTLPATETTRYIRIDAWHPGPESADVAFEFQFKGTPVVSSNNAPSLAWTGEAGYTGDGIDPDSAASGTAFEFRIDYTDSDNNAPTLMQVWIDDNYDGSYASGEKHDLVVSRPRMAATLPPEIRRRTAS
ncbi:MAG: Ig-like domain-containing protein, partial [Desulfuromonadaceae bacterium]